MLQLNHRKDITISNSDVHTANKFQLCIRSHHNIRDKIGRMKSKMGEKWENKGKEK